MSNVRNSFTEMKKKRLDNGFFLQSAILQN